MAHCTDAYGQVLHFPSGTYREQLQRTYGLVELELMQSARSWCRTFGKDLEKYKKADMQLMSWLDSKPQPGPIVWDSDENNAIARLRAVLRGI